MELDSMILMGPLQLGKFYDSMNPELSYSIKKKKKEDIDLKN